jgi:type II secretory pathway pseudopilin PulG
MALQVLPTPPRITGPEMLGAAVANASERYANTARQDQLMERARTNQLADVADARAYSEARYDRERFDRLDDRQREAAQQIRNQMVNEAVKEGLLRLDEVDEEPKVAAAIQEMARRGLLAKYKTLIETNVLKPADVTNPLAVDTAMETAAARNAELIANEREQLWLRQQDFTRLRQEEQRIQGQIQQLSADLQRAADYVPTEAEVANVALALATSQKKPGERPSRDEIDAQRAAAMQQLREVGMQNQYLDRQTKAVQLQALSQQLAAIKANTQEYIRRGIGPQVLSEPAAAPASAPTSAAPAGGSPMESFIGMLEAEEARRKAAADAADRGSEPEGAAPSAPAPIYTPTPSVGRKMTQRRANEAVGDWMRGLGYGIVNLMRPSSWHGNMDAAYLDVDPEVLIPQLKSRLAAMSDQNSAAAADLKNAIYELSLRGRGTPFSELPSPQQVQAARGSPRTELLNLPGPSAAPGRPITSAPPVFPTPTTWWAAGR